MLDFILDDFTWSFSRIETFERCPYCFYLQYIKCKESTSGFFDQYGTLHHYILEQYFKNNLMEFELSQEYRNTFDKIVTSLAMPNPKVDLRKLYYDAGLEYFDNFTGFANMNIIEVEKEHKFKIDKYDFTGTIDIESDTDIIDHKTKGKLHITKLNKKHNKSDWVCLEDGRYIPFENIIQLYLYSIPYFQNYKKYPEYLNLNMTRIHDWYKVKFNIEDFERAKSWAVNQINKIYNTKEFNKGDMKSMWCSYVCSQRFNCKYSDRYVDMGV